MAGETAADEMQAHYQTLFGRHLDDLPAAFVVAAANSCTEAPDASILDVDGDDPKEHGYRFMWVRGGAFGHIQGRATPEQWADDTSESPVMAVAVCGLEALTISSGMSIKWDSDDNFLYKHVTSLHVGAFKEPLILPVTPRAGNSEEFIQRIVEYLSNR